MSRFRALRSSSGSDEDRKRKQAGVVWTAGPRDRTAHMFVGSKASWHEILDDLPQHDEYPWS
jgi:hypothetical protein